MAELSVVGAPASVRRNDVFTIDVRVRNLGEEAWPAEGTRPVVVSYRLIDAESNEALVHDGSRTFLPHDLAPGDEVRTPVMVRATAHARPVIAEMRVLQEHCRWFDATALAPIDVTD
jgi:hypothetical protein